MVMIDKSEYLKIIDENKFSAIGMIIFQKGELAPTILWLREKHTNVWGFRNVHLIPLRRGYYQALMFNMNDRNLVMSKGPIMMKP